MKVLTEHRSMQRETEALKRLKKHKNIVTFYGTEQEVSVLYMCISISILCVCIYMSSGLAIKLHRH